VSLSRTVVAAACVCLLGGTAAAQQAESGRRTYGASCANCHGGDGNGGELGPAIATRVAARTDAEIATVIRQGFPGGGMPAFAALTEQDVTGLVAFLRTLRPRAGTAPATTRVTLADGATLTGLLLNQGMSDLQLLDDQRHIRLLRREGDRYRLVTSQADWPTYDGQITGGRYSPLAQIHRDNVGSLAPAWVFTLPNTANLQVTPIVADGVMYVTSANEAYALDAGSGREIWHYRRPRTKGLQGVAARGTNRGVAVAGERLFMVTDHAHLIALNRFTGALLWDSTTADWQENYNATGAPLVVGNLVISGVANGDAGARGFLAAFDQASGKEVWRFWTTPARGEPLADGWRGAKALDHPGGATWMTGVYDAALDTLYWPVGNPAPDFDGSGRAGDNLYTDSILALDAKTGRLKWHFQFTPHDVWDYDAQEPMLLRDMMWDGRPRQLLMQANRNGFFYVLDRTNGKFLIGKPFTKSLTWATGLTPEGRPIVAPGAEPTVEGTRVCPHVDGASNWYSASFNPMTELYYVNTNDSCGVFTRTPMEWERAKFFTGGTTTPTPESRRLLRAIDVRTGRIAWELAHSGAADSWGGVVSTAGGIVIFCEESGALAAADATTGKLLWSFQTSVNWRASPMTYMFDNRQYVAVAAGPNILAFAVR